MTVFFPQGVGQLAETLVSVKRIQKYMMYEEVERKALPSPLSDTLDQGDKKSGQLKYPSPPRTPVVERKTAAIVCTNVAAKWDAASTENTLDQVNLSVEPGNLVAIIGRVGAGKSSLIQAILKELTISSGEISVYGDISYASQEPWLFSASVRQNILFGLPMIKARYKEVVKRCALERDFELFEYGDKTIVGERGTSLSGGQRARISLARACYRDASIYLLDDPLSAVDAHVGRHLFEQCVKTFLKGKTIILVTHQLQFLQSADKIFIMDKGRIVDSGTYDFLRESGLDMAQMMSKTSENSELEEEDQFKKTSDKGNRSRLNSESSVESTADDKPVAAPPKMVEEQRREGSISLDVYKKYFGAMGGFCAFFWVVTFFTTTQMAASGGDYFLSYWTNKEDGRNETERDSNATVDIYIFSGLTVGTVIITLARSFLFFTVSFINSF